MTAKREITQGNRIIWTVLAICVFLMGIGVCALCLAEHWLFGKKIFTNISDQRILNVCEQTIGFEFPKDTHILGHDSLDWQHYDISMKVAFHKDGLDDFLKSPAFKYATLSDTKRELTDIERLPWFTPESAQRFLSGRISPVHGDLTDILIDLDSESKVIVYFEWIGDTLKGM